MNTPHWTLPLLRLVLRLRGKRPGDVRAMQELLELRGVFRFSALFAGTILTPAALLAYFALSSIRAEELFIDADFERRADAAADRVITTLDDEFSRFERSTQARLSNRGSAAGSSAVGLLSELSPHLRLAVPIDTNGKFEVPFDRIETVPETTAFRRALVAAQNLEHSGRHAEALAAFEHAESLADNSASRAAATLGRARVLLAQGHAMDGERLLGALQRSPERARDEFRFRIDDLAQLLLAERLLGRDATAGTRALQSLAETLTQRRWTLGQTGEATIARRAMALLDGRVPPDWSNRILTSIDDKALQLRWAEKLSGELPSIAPADPVDSAQTDSPFRYIERPDLGVVWCLYEAQGLDYVFAFDQAALTQRARNAAADATAEDPQLRASLSSLRAAHRETDHTVRSLGPWLPSLTVAVAPADNAGLNTIKARKRARRVAIIALAFAMSTLGVVVAVRLVRRELDSAKVKADFAANVSHELRSPITQIRLKGEALQLGLVYDDTDRQAHYDAIVHEAERLSRLVDNVLDFSSIESGAKRYQFRPEDLGEILYNSVEAARDAAEIRGITIENDISDDLPVVWVDREAIAQVMTNLISNATKYGAEGGWLGVRARLAPEVVEIEVADRGPGIRMEDQERIFERFYRSSDPAVRKNRGTGIGLTIVRYIVEEHGGTIRVDSSPGRGTAFRFTLPLAPRDIGA